MKPPIQGILIVRPRATRGAETTHYFHRGEAPMNAEQLRAEHPERFAKSAPDGDRLHVSPLSASTVSAMRFLDACAEQGDVQAQAEVNHVLAASRRWAQGIKPRRPAADDIDFLLQPRSIPGPASTSRGPQP